MMTTSTQHNQFIGDPLKPDAATIDASRMAIGEPGLPGKFHWRDQTIEVQSVVRSWRETGPCSHGSDERYVQKHWYELITDHGNMRVYFERKPRGGSVKMRWWLYSIQATNCRQ
jgi:phosphoribosylglycinamide formyltransferase-1